MTVLNEKDVRELTEKEGWTAKQIAKHFGCTRGNVVRVWRKYNIKPKNGPGNGHEFRESPTGPAPSYDVEKIRALSALMMTSLQIADELGIASGTVRKVWRIHNIPHVQQKGKRREVGVHFFNTSGDPELKQEPTIYEDIPLPGAKMVTLLDRGPSQCCWPHGEKGGYTYCGLPRAKGEYCAEHATKFRSKSNERD